MQDRDAGAREEFQRLQSSLRAEHNEQLIPLKCPWQGRRGELPAARSVQGAAVQTQPWPGAVAGSKSCRSRV